MLREYECVVCGNKFTVERGGNPPKTCSAECKRRRKLEHNMHWRQSAVIPEHVHGSVEGYATYGCRCDDCREANTTYHRSYRKKTE